MQNIRIHTTQNVVIEYPTASIGHRILANLFDLLILVVYYIIFISNESNFNLSSAGWVIVGLPPAFYHLYSELLMDGQTLGMKLTKIKVMRLDGAQPSLFNYVLRWMMRLVDVWIGGGAIAVITIAAGGRGQRLGDMAAGTTVVSLRQQASLEDMLLPVIEGTYEPIYPQVVSLSDRDISIIKEALSTYTRNSSADPILIEVLTRKVKELLQIEEPVAPIAFLQTVLRDHTYLTAHA
ncbi:MAG: RDD family protein [Bacteroidota bacterium]